MCKRQRLLCAVTFTDVMTIWVHHLCWYRTATDGTDNLSSYRFPILHWSGPIISYWKGNWATTTRPRRWLKFAIALNRCLAIATNGDGLFFCADAIRGHPVRSLGLRFLLSHPVEVVQRKWLECLCSRSPERHVVNSTVEFRSKGCTKSVGVPSLVSSVVADLLGRVAPCPMIVSSSSELLALCRT